MIICTVFSIYKEQTDLSYERISTSGVEHLCSDSILNLMHNDNSAGRCEIVNKVRYFLFLVPFLS